MIAQNDLRYGNWVNCYGMTFKIGILDEYCVEPIGGNEGGFPYVDLNAIPLTEDILIKAGFEITDEDNYFQMKYWYNKDLDFKISVCTEDCTVSTQKKRLCNLHDLQNWVNINTGTELIITL